MNNNTSKIIIAVIIIILALFALGLFVSTSDEEVQVNQPVTSVASFEECVAAGNPVMESEPRQCASGGTTYTESTTKNPVNVIITSTTTISSTTSAPSAPEEQILCTMDAKQCPDGSYVGRQGPRCEFAACPGN
jgi:hypothetical protein